MKQFRLTLFVKADKLNDTGEVPVFVKIIANGTNTSLNLNVKVDEQRWKITKQFRITKALKELRIRRDLDELLTTINIINQNLKSKGLPFSASTIKKCFYNEDIEGMTENLMLSELFQMHYKNYKPLVDDQSRVPESLRKYQTLKNHVYDFLQFEFGLEDIPLNKLNYRFIEAFDTFLRSMKHIGNNTTVKYVQAFKSIIRLAIKYDWLQKDPFVLYDKKIKVKDVEFLNEDELKKLEQFDFENKRLDVVRDIFIFGCYTGYAPIDIHKLKYSDIIVSSEGQKWIITKRSKTGIKSDVPLLSKAELIIEKYKNDFYCLKTGHILPKRSNQKMNAYLKEIAVCTGITKNLHHYLSRHTFASTVILANGLSMEVLSKMLGHTNLKQTMHYGKIQNTRVGQEMKLLQEKLKQVRY